MKHQIAKLIWILKVKRCVRQCVTYLKDNHNEQWQRRHIKWLFNNKKRITLIATDPRIDSDLTKNLIQVIRSPP